MDKGTQDNYPVITKFIEYLETGLEKLREDFAVEYPSDLETPLSTEYFAVLDCFGMLVQTLRDIKAGNLSPDATTTLNVDIRRLRTVAQKAIAGNQQAISQYRAVVRLLNADRYELTKQDFDEVANKDRSDTTLAKGLEVRYWMAELSRIVLPVLPGGSLLSGQVRLNEHTQERSIFRKAAKPEYWKRGNTLQQLAMKVYLQRLVDAGYQDVNESTIYDSLRAVEEWERPFVQELRDIVAKADSPEAARAGVRQWEKIKLLDTGIRVVWLNWKSKDDWMLFKNYAPGRLQKKKTTAVKLT